MKISLIQNCDTASYFYKSDQFSLPNMAQREVGACISPLTLSSQLIVVMSLHCNFDIVIEVQNRVYGKREIRVCVFLKKK